MGAPARWILVLATAAGLGACTHGGQPDETGAETAQPAAALVVYAVNYPLRYFAERVGGDLVDVVFPAPAGVDPAYWSPDPQTVVAYQKADLILLNGADYARWVQQASLPQARLVDTSASFRDRYAPLGDEVVHTHGPEGKHSHKGVAFTTWLDPTLAIEHARAIMQALSAARPDEEPAFREAFEKLEADLRKIDEQLASVTGAIGGEPLVFSHPVYQYFIRRYGLNGRSLHWEPDESPPEAAWRELETLLEGHPARWMVWEGAPLDETARRLEAMGLRSLVYAPCGNVPDAGDFLTVMQQNVERLTKITDQLPPPAATRDSQGTSR